LFLQSPKQGRKAWAKKLCWRNKRLINRRLGCGSNLQAGLQYSNILPVLEKMTTPTRASHSTASSLAFLSSPPRRLEKVTCRFVEFSIRLISIFPRPMAPGGRLRSIQKQHVYLSLELAARERDQDANSLLPARGSSKLRG